MRKELLYHAAGLCILPACPIQKYPTLSSWHGYQKKRPTQKHVDTWFNNGHPGCCLIAGAISGNLEMLDFDCSGEKYDAWRGLVDPKLLASLVIERSPSGGYHVAYLCEVAVSGNLKLAQRQVEAKADDDGKAEFFGKRYKVVKGHVILTTIETRGEKGLFLCDPTPGYSLIQGSFESLPIITEAERDTLLSAAWSLNEYFPKPIPIKQAKSSKSTGDGLRPGDDFNQRGDVREVLRNNGWTLVKGGDNEYWCRPGKVNACSATLKDRVFYVFSTSVELEANVGHAPFAVYSALEHGGDFTAAAIALRRDGFGDETDLPKVDLSAFDKPAKVTQDPGPIPVGLLRVPGFISELMDFTLKTAPYPNVAMSFCGALAMQSFIAGRKVRDSSDNRTNLYLLGLAHSGSGKDWPRRANIKLAHEIGCAASIGGNFASGEGIQDAMYATPAMLFQTDEIDGIIRAINTARDSKHEAIINTLLQLYSSASSVFPMRKKAIQKGKVVDQNLVINQPSLTLFGTAIPNHYYEALSERMLTNGFFSRTLVIESGKRAEGQKPSISDLPKTIVARAKWWHDLQTGLVADLNPTPKTVEYTDAGSKAIAGLRIASDANYALAEERNDTVGTTLWSRVNEQVCKLALIYAVSEYPEAPSIGVKAVEWASELVRHITTRMLFMATGHVADNPFEQECLRLIEKLRKHGGVLKHSEALKKSKLACDVFSKVITTLNQRREIDIEIEAGVTNKTRQYRLLV